MKIETDKFYILQIWANGGVYFKRSDNDLADLLAEFPDRWQLVAMPIESLSCFEIIECKRCFYGLRPDISSNVIYEEYYNGIEKKIK